MVVWKRHIDQFCSLEIYFLYRSKNYDNLFFKIKRSREHAHEPLARVTLDHPGVRSELLVRIGIFKQGATDKRGEYHQGKNPRVAMNFVTQLIGLKQGPHPKG